MKANIYSRQDGRITRQCVTVVADPKAMCGGAKSTRLRPKISRYFRSKQISRSKMRLRTRRCKRSRDRVLAQAAAKGHRREDFVGRMLDKIIAGHGIVHKVKENENG